MLSATPEPTSPIKRNFQKEIREAFVERSKQFLQNLKRTPELARRLREVPLITNKLIEDAKQLEFHTHLDFKLQSIMGLCVPKIYDYKGLHVLYIIYIVLLLCVHSSLYIWDLLQHQQTYEIVVDALYFIFVVVAVIHSTFTKRKERVVFYKSLVDLDDCFYRKFGVSREDLENFGSLEWFLIHCSVVFYIIIQKVFQNQICYRVFSLYIISLVALQIYYQVLSLRDRFILLNSKIQDVVYNIRIIKRLKLRKLQFFEQNSDLLWYLKKHDLLCDLVEVVSQSFGAQLLGIYALVILSFVEVLVAQSAVSLAGFLILIVIIAAISTSCEQALASAYVTCKVAARLCLVVDPDDSLRERNVALQLRMLSEQVQRRNLRFSLLEFNLDVLMYLARDCGCLLLVLLQIYNKIV